MVLRFHGKVVFGKFIPEEPEKFIKSFEQHESKRITVAIGRYRKPRSIEENYYYWGVIIKMLAEEFESNCDHILATDWWHEYLKTLFLKEISYKSFNKKQIRCERVKSTTELSTIEAERYYEDIRRWAAVELNFLIPEPNKIM